MTQTETLFPSEKRVRFVRIAEARTTRAIKSIRLIRNLKNTYLYEYSSVEIDAIIAALQHEVDELTRTFTEKNKKCTEFRINPVPLAVAN